MSKDKYRITNVSKDNFIIEMLVERTTGLFWWKKTVTEIKLSNIYLGKGFNVYYRNVTRTCKKCGKIEDVK